MGCKASSGSPFIACNRLQRREGIGRPLSGLGFRRGNDRIWVVSRRSLRERPLFY